MPKSILLSTKTLLTAYTIGDIIQLSKEVVKKYVNIYHTLLLDSWYGTLTTKDVTKIQLNLSELT